MVHGRRAANTRHLSPNEGEDRRRAERARQVGLFRYGLIQDLIDPKLTTRQRGKLARELAEKEHTDPFGRQVRVARGTLDRWARHYRAGGFPALVPAPRQVTPRTPVEVLDCRRSRISPAVWSRNSPPCRWRSVGCEGPSSTGWWPLADSAEWECSSGPKRRRVLVRPGSEPT
ncbi:helix-turn-helix domain-containing protein [Streptomyces sp. NPDC057460]|uniref:helix-turn-helix domain-containing protein n=1 Tax=Streptomyces sp. NPDC057460 TaxID=3346141 RepID=UPI00368D1B47